MVETRIATLFCLAASVLIALSYGIDPATAEAPDPNLSKHLIPNDAKAEAQKVCSSVLPSGEIGYFLCEPQSGHVCSTVTTDGEIIYFVCGDVQQGRKIN